MVASDLTKNGINLNILLLARNPDSKMNLAYTWATYFGFFWSNIHLGPQPKSGIYTETD